MCFWKNVKTWNNKLQYSLIVGASEKGPQNYYNLKIKGMRMNPFYSKFAVHIIKILKMEDKRWSVNNAASNRF